jgi:hypothetical protein
MVNPDTGEEDPEGAEERVHSGGVVGMIMEKDREG